jgi:lysophospholipase L1-like esterase
MIQANDVILFQGDSITDAGRTQDNGAANDPAALGRGFAMLAAARLLSQRPDDNLRILNRGISGNKIWELQERWQQDCLDLEPDVLSILVGVNDTWHGQTDPQLRVPLDRYEAIYRKLLDDARAANPALRLVLCEPFTLLTGAVTASWFPEIDQRREIVSRTAADYDAVFVPFQALFDRLAAAAPKPYWLGDGVHPTLSGHQQMADLWVQTVV